MMRKMRRRLRRRGRVGRRSSVFDGVVRRLWTCWVVAKMWNGLCDFDQSMCMDIIDKQVISIPSERLTKYEGSWKL